MSNGCLGSVSSSYSNYLAVKALSIFGVTVASFYLGFCFFLYFYQSRLIFHPKSLIKLTPEEVALEYEDIWLPIASGGRIHGWWLPGADPTRTLLYLHGNGGNISDNLEHARRFQQMGFSVFLFDYRGYGLSDGPFPNESRVYEDATAAWDYLTQAREIQPADIYLYGHSLGGAIAIELASHQPQAAALIVQGSFTSMQAAAKAVGRYQLIPIRLLLTQRFDSLSKVEDLNMPLLFIHGLADDDVPARMSRQLYEASPQPKQLWLVPMAGHTDLARIAGQTYFDRVQDFLAESAGNPSGLSAIEL